MVGKKVAEETRREDILRAAYDVAARQGVEALTLRAVAARADVSHGTVLFHFKRKRELVASLVDRVLYATAALRDWTSGGRNATIRQKIRVALEQYREGFSDLSGAIVNGEFRPSRRRGSQNGEGPKATATGVAAVV